MSAFEHGYAVVVGVAGYGAAGRDLPELPLAVLNDAVDLARTLWDPEICGYRADRVHLLLEEQATAAGILRELEWLRDHARGEDTAIFFFSGHGWLADGASYLAAYDARTDDLDSGMLPTDELSNRFKAIGAGRLVVLLDSCFAGAMQVKGRNAALGSRGTAALDQRTYDTLSAGHGRVLIAASGPDEESTILPRERNSLFSSCLLRGLRGEAATATGVRIFDLFDFVSREVQEQSRGRQTPVLNVSVNDNFPIALLRAIKPDSASELAQQEPLPLPPSADERYNIHIGEIKDSKNTFNQNGRR